MPKGLTDSEKLRAAEEMRTAIKYNGAADLRMIAADLKKGTDPKEVVGLVKGVLTEVFFDHKLKPERQNLLHEIFGEAPGVEKSLVETDELPVDETSSIVRKTNAFIRKIYSGAVIVPPAMINDKKIRFIGFIAGDLQWNFRVIIEAIKDQLAAGAPAIDLIIPGEAAMLYGINAHPGHSYEPEDFWKYVLEEKLTEALQKANYSVRTYYVAPEPPAGEAFDYVKNFPEYRVIFTKLPRSAINHPR